MKKMKNMKQNISQILALTQRQRQRNTSSSGRVNHSECKFPNINYKLKISSNNYLRLIKINTFADYPEDDSTWEPKDHLDNVKDIIARFERSSKKPNATKNDSSSNAPKKGSSTATGKKDE